MSKSIIEELEELQLLYGKQLILLQSALDKVKKERSSISLLNVKAFKEEEQRRFKVCVIEDLVKLPDKNYYLIQSSYYKFNDSWICKSHKYISRESDRVIFKIIEVRIVDSKSYVRVEPSEGGLPFVGDRFNRYD